MLELLLQVQVQLSVLVTRQTTGTYTVVAIGGSATCTSNMTGSATVAVTAAPTAYAVTGGGSYCTGGDGVAIGLDGSQDGVSYQLRMVQQMLELLLQVQVRPISFGNQTAPGTYTVVAIGGTTNCTSEMTGSATVAITAAPTAYNVTGGGSYCTGGDGVAIGLDGSQTDVSYQLKNGTANVGTAVAGTGSAISFGNQTAAGTLYCCSYRWISHLYKQYDRQ
jgi:hypothetical protein